MKRTTVFLDEAMVRRARRYARKAGVSFAAVVREAVAMYLGAREGEAGGGAVPTVAGRFASRRGDTSERVDELLWQEPDD